MQLAPRYHGPVILSIDDDPAVQLAPVTRQRRRFEALLGELSDEQWNAPSRCDGWSTRDVISHLVTVNGFWHASVQAGLGGTPTRFLAGFDPAATPPLLVSSMSAASTTEVFERFVASNRAFLDGLAALTDDQWSMPAEAPPGHVPIRLLAQHALWDSWAHERDVAIPLGIEPAVEDDEVISCLQYAAAVSPVLGIGVGRADTGVLSLAATDPETSFVLEVGECVRLRPGAIDAGTPCLRGNAVELTEALTLRAPMPSSTPAEWRAMLGGLETAFDAT